jgi:adenylosuccinate lyase
MIPRYSLPEMSAIWSEENRFKLMLKVELTVLEVLALEGIIPKKDFQNIKSKVSLNIPRIKEIEKITKHDLASFVEQLSESVNDQTSRWVHYGLTSSDILDTATALQLKLSSKLIIEKLSKLKLTLKQQSLKYKKFLIMGRTHGMHAEPTTLGYKFLSWYYEIDQHLQIFKWLLNKVIRGKISGVVGTYSQLSPRIEKLVLKKLGLLPEPVSTQVVPRYRYAYYVSTLASIASSLERFATEIRHLQRTEISELEEKFSSGQKGSSAMPHKHNPVGSENICGLARLVRSYVISSYENIALWHERDISHSSNERIILPDINIVVDYMLTRFENIINEIVVFPENMLTNISKSYNTFYSQLILSNLIKKGLKRNDAYKIVQQIATESILQKKDFIEKLSKNKEITKYLSSKEIKKLCSIKYLLRNVEEKFDELC